MAEETTILQNWIFTKFLFPFILVWFIVFALLEKTKILGEKKQINIIVSAVIGLIFVGAVYPKLVVGNLILFLTVAIVAVFVIILLWAFVFSGVSDSHMEKYLKLGLGIVVTIAFIWAVVWATGWSENLANLFSGESSLGQTIIVNGVFLLVIAGALALVLMKSKSSS